MKFDLDQLLRTNIKKLSPYASARDEYADVDADMVFLDANENPYENGVNRYPDPQQRSLKSLLATHKGVMEPQILLGNGSDEILDLIFRAFCEPHQDNVITLPPTYGMYKVLAETNAIENRQVVLSQELQPRIGKILDHVDSHTKLILLSSPNNPTGNLFHIGLLEQLLRNFSGLVVIDEAYIDFANADSWVGRLGEFPNLIVTQTLSKAYGMAGIRLGICYASPNVITILNKIKPPYNVNILTQQRALRRLEDKEMVYAEVERILNARQVLVTALNTISFIDHVYPSDANFILVRVDDATVRYNQLLKKGIVVRNRSTQPLCEHTLRLTVGTSAENEQLMTAFAEMANTDV